jgi:hypothetical protein
VTQEIEIAQRALCSERNAEFLATPGSSKLGFALATVGLRPVNGLRHLATSETNGRAALKAVLAHFRCSLDRFDMLVL